MPDFLIPIVDFLKTLGVKLGWKFFDIGVDSVMTRKRRRKNEFIINDIQKTSHETNDMVSRLVSEDSEQIKRIASNLQSLIETLHVKTAHGALDDLRKTISITDRKTLSRVDYYRACCSRYVNRQQTIDEVNLSYQEMVDAAVYIPEIVAAKIYVHCITDEMAEAKRAAEKLKTVDRKNIWAWVPDLLYSKDLEKSYNALPEEIDRLLVLANTCMLGKRETLEIDLATIKVQLPQRLTFENIPLWSFNLSVLINRFFPEWNRTALRSDNEVGKATRQLYEGASLLLDLQSKTELSELLVDIDFWHAMSGCLVNPTEEILDSLKSCPCRKELEEYREVAVVTTLFKQNRYDEAKLYLDKCLVTAAMLNQRFLLSLQTADPEYAIETFRMAVSNQVAFPSMLMTYALLAINNFPNYVIPYAKGLRLESVADADVYHQICNFYEGETPDLHFLQDNQLGFSRPFQPFVAIVLHANGYVEEGLSLMKSCVPEETVDLATSMYVNLLVESPSHIADLYDYLKHIREYLHYTENERWLRIEYSLASKLSDFSRMLEVSRILYQKRSEDTEYFICYLQALVHADDKDSISMLIERMHQYTFTPSQVHMVFNQLILAGFPDSALNILYDACQKYPTNEELSLAFFQATVVPVTAAIINKEDEKVMDGSYIHYSLNGESKTAIIDEKNRLSFLISHKKGDIVQQPNWRGTPEAFQVNGIYNKYFQLSERIYQDIADNKFYSVKSIRFSNEEIKSGTILEDLTRLAGRGQDYQVRLQVNLRQYKDGKLSLAAFLKDYTLVPDLYDLLFGDFKIYGFSTADYESLYESQHAQINSLQPVLDLPSLILVFELWRKFGLSFDQKFIIPRVIVHYLEMTLLNEEHGSPSGVLRPMVEKLSSANTDENWLASRIKELLQWINTYVQIEDTTDRLNHDSTIFQQSQYFTLAYDCYSLVKRGRVLICADKVLIQSFAKSIPVSDVNYLLHDRDDYVSISHFFMDVNLYGGDLDVEYVNDEYVKYISSKPSCFLQCKENLQYCPSQYNTTLEFCRRVSSNPVVTPSDGLVIDNLLSSLFQSMGRQSSLAILQGIIKDKASEQLKLYALYAYKTVYPIIEFNSPKPT